MKSFILTVCLFGAVFAASPLIEWKPLPVDDPTVIKLAGQAVIDINARENSLYYNKLIEIKEAKSRIVSGIEYQLKLIIRKTNCPKSKPYTDACQIKEDSPPELCTVDLWEHAGSKEIKMTSYSCAAA